MTSVLVGLQYGDEGKARIFDYFVSQESQKPVAVRFQGGSNAGHTIFDNDGTKFICHMMPSGVLRSDSVNIIGRGCVFDLVSFTKELGELQERFKINLRGRLFVDENCPVILPHHIEKDINYFQKSIGTTSKGIGPCYSEFFSRKAIFLKDLFSDEILHNKLEDLSEINAWTEAFSRTDIFYFIKKYREAVKPFLADTNGLIRKFISNKYYKLMFEGAQGYGLDVWTGEHPFVTSSCTTVGSVLTTTGINHKEIDNVVGVMKAYKTYVGEGEFPTELLGQPAEQLRESGSEYGATTGRPRRVGWLDLREVKKAIEANGIDEIALTKIDILNTFGRSYIMGVDGDYYSFDTSWKTNYSEANISSLPNEFREIVSFISESLKVPIRYVSYGPKRNQIIEYKNFYKRFKK
jgi:adenylosuccinate synthase